MRRTARILRRLLRSDDGPTAVEYAVLLALVLLVCIGAVKSVGSAVSASLENTAQLIGGGSSDSGTAGASGGGSSSGSSGSGKGGGKGGGGGSGKGSGKGGGS